MNLKNTLFELRKKINIIDEELLNLLSQRRDIAIQIAKNKIIHKYPIRDKTREKELLEQLIIIGKKKFLSKNYIKEVFQIIIQDSITIQKKIKKNLNTYDNFTQPKFSFLGPKGSYSHIATIEYAKKKYKNFNEIEHINFSEIFQEVENKKSDYAIIPIENISFGFINEIYDLLYKTHLYIIEEFKIPIKHCLLVKPSMKIEDINIVYSHSQPFKQCKNFIEKFPYWKIKYTNSTSQAIHKVSQSKKNNIAAIGNPETGIQNNLKPIHKNITNYKKNNTRFIVLSKYQNNSFPMCKSKIILMISITKKNIKLSNILLILKQHNIQIITIESKTYQYNKTLQETFYIEIKGNSKFKTMQQILNLLKLKNLSIKILGHYPI